MTEELKEQIHERVYNIKVPTLGFSRRDLFNIAMEYAEPREKRIAELEAQIAELKEKNNNLVASSKIIISLSDESEAITMEQLTKAKELIKTLLLIADNKVSQMEFQLCVADAKQFLKE